MKDKGSNLRIYLVYFVFSLLFFSLSLRITYLQTVKRKDFLALAKSQHSKVITVKGERGRIFDRNNRVLATNIVVYSVYMDPKFVRNKKDTAEKLAKELGLRAKDILDKLSASKRFVWIKRKISPKEKERLAQLNLKGVYFLREYKRFYPQGALASHILGGVDIDNRGIEGVELFYDKFLRGKEGLVSVLKDSASRSLYTYPQVLYANRGLDLNLTIDIQLQYWVESCLKETIDKYSAHAGSVIVINPFTGEVLALANFPTYDPNHIGEASAREIRNRAIGDIFEPGSVFKIVTLVGSLDRKIFSLGDTIYCENGRFKIPGSILHDWKPYGELTYKEVFKKSSNIGVAKIASRLGATVLYSYIRRMGFGQKTGIDLPGEAKGILKDPRAWSNTSSYIIPIGQEIGVTVLQLAQAMCVVVNGGYLVKPHVCKEFRGSYGLRKEFRLNKRRVVPSGVSSMAKRILIEVVNDGTGKLAKIEGIVVGGKTGTAQKYDVEKGRYSPYAYRASFAGFIENDGKSFVICVSIDEPYRSHFGGVVAAPLFRKIAEKIVEYEEANKRIAAVR